MFQITRIKDNGHEILQLSGDLTIYSAAEARHELETHLSQHPTLVLDLSEIDELDTSGVQVLLWLKREAAARVGALSLVRHSPAVVETFDLLHVTGIFGDPILIGPA
ncbi:STAS domain-containing protein [Holophaga foetida]|uniref:STAS domain-containing protein n=1 Tax=Holophaga foetida TaxID=35839 RepID=UPI00024750D0|nr:STAS domain-containing protein [Holophaga foetida]